jgi:hypothetical protein
MVVGCILIIVGFGYGPIKWGTFGSKNYFK